MSPFCILNTLTILYRGSKTHTQQELHSHLYYKHRELIYSGAIDTIKQLNKNPDISFFNVISVPSEINKTFQRHVSSIGMIMQINKDYRGQAQKINTLAHKYTNGMFTNIIGEHDLKSGYITGISMMFSKANWMYPFPKSSTTQIHFSYKSMKRAIYAMHLYDKRLNYTEDSEYQVVELDYKCRTLTMGFVLPKRDILPKLTEQQLDQYVDNLSPTYVNVVQIPRFMHEGRYRLNGMLQKMQITNLFRNADLSDLTPHKTKVSNIMHHCAVIVDEGNDATQQARKPSVMDGMSTMFLAKHPFMYYLRYKPLNLMLITGIYV